MRLITLTKAWSHDDQEFEAGTQLEVDDTTAKAIVADGYGTLAEDAPIVKTVDAGSNTKTASNGTPDVVTVTREDYDKMVADLVEAKATEAAMTKANGRGNMRVRLAAEGDECRGYAKGVRGLGDVLSDMMTAETTGKIPERLQACTAPPGTKTVGTDEFASVEEAIGGWWIPPAHDPRLLEKGIEDDWVRANGAVPIPVAGQMVTVNAITDVNRTSTLYNGIQVFTTKEKGAMTAATGTFEQIELKPKAVTGLYYMTDALMHYAPAMGAVLGGMFRDALIYKQLQQFTEGTGAGESMGIFNAGAKYEQSPESEQAAATILTPNVLKMRSHMRPQEYSKSVWLASLSCMEQLNTLTIDVGTGGSTVALVNITNDGIERILGRPLIYTEFAAAVGTATDLTLVSWPTYLIGEGTYASSDSSIHVRFLENETAFRFVMQLDGQPWWRTTLTLRNSWEVAPIVTLAART